MSRSPFPPAEPASLTDAEAITDNDWSAFSGLRTMADHWARPAWPDGAKAVYWLLNLGGYPELRASAKACTQALSDIPDLDVVPLDLLHLTLCRVSSTSDVSDNFVAEARKAALDRIGSLCPFKISVGPLTGSSGAIRFSVTPWDTLFRLYEGLVGTRNFTGGGTASSGFRPHVSIAYNARHRPAEPIVENVRTLHRYPTVELTIIRVDLVKLRREGHIYRWQPLDHVLLKGQAN